MSILTTDVRLTKRGFLVTIIPYFTFLTWYYVFSLSVLRHAVGSSAGTYLMVNVSFNFIIAITLLSGSLWIHKFNKIHIIYKSSIVTSIVTILVLFTSSIILRLIIISVAGIFFSIGQLAFFMYFWSLTISRERGRMAGLVVSLSLPLFNLIGLMAQTFDFFRGVMLSVTIISGTLVIKLLRPEKKVMLTAKKDDKGSHPEKRTILLYAVPWALFSLINASLARNMSLYVLQSIPFSSYMFLTVLQVVAAGFGALGGGIIADFFGRRLALAFGLSLYGISSALVGLVKNYEMFVFVYVANGLNWGILLTLYLLVVWGDLANKESCAKRYSIGLIIFYVAMGIGSLIAHQISQISIIVSSLVSCLLIFLSNIPLVLAPELVPSDFRDRIKLRLYMKVLRKLHKKLQG